MDYGHTQSQKELEKLEKRIKKEYEQASKEVDKKLNKFLDRQMANNAKMEALLDEGKITFNEYLDWSKKQTILSNKWFDMRHELTEVYMNADKAAAQMINEHRFDIYALNYNYGTYEIEKQARIDTAFTLYDRQVVTRLVKDNPKLLPPIGKSTKEAIRRGEMKKWTNRQIQSAMTQGILQGESIDKISKRLAENVGEKCAYQHYRAARTMTTSAENAGRIDSYRRAESMGIKMGKTWLAAHDNHTRRTHRLYDGVTLPIEEEFAPNLMFPADPDGDPAEVYNCRCSLVGTVMSIDGIDMTDITASKNWADEWDIDYEEWKSGHKTAT